MLRRIVVWGVAPLVALVAILTGSHALRGDDAALCRQADEALRRAVAFFHKQVSTQGGYVWRYSHDLKLREGEGRATDTMVWVQPPGTPTVGMAYLEAYRLCRDDYLLQAARDAAHALRRGQLRSGGWAYHIEFDPQRRMQQAYRVDPPRATTANNSSTLDDNTTQSALRFLMELDAELRLADAELHDTVQYALDGLLQAQYPNGAWPQRFRGPPPPEAREVKPASIPATWPRTWPGANYSAYYTLNDNAHLDTMEVLFRAAEIYQQPRYREAALRGGDFLVLAQLPDPQPGWAQQYDFDMHPAWARRFEPPAVTGGESQHVMRMLLRCYRETGERKYLESVRRGLAYYRTLLLPDGRLARFYELGTNKPLYFTRDYQLTYGDDDLPTHYGFKVSSTLDRIEQEYRQLAALSDEELARLRNQTPGASTPPRLTDRLRQQLAAVIGAQDQRGAWVEEGTVRTAEAAQQTGRVIQSQTFAQNLLVLARGVAACRAALQK
jgi:hypothetical protein